MVDKARRVGEEAHEPVDIADIQRRDACTELQANSMQPIRVACRHDHARTFASSTAGRLQPDTQLPPSTTTVWPATVVLTVCARLRCFPGQDCCGAIGRIGTFRAEIAEHRAEIHFGLSTLYRPQRIATLIRRCVSALPACAFPERSVVAPGSERRDVDGIDPIFDGRVQQLET